MTERLTSDRLSELAAQIGGTPRLTKTSEDVFLLEITAPDGALFDAEQDVYDEQDDAVAVLAQTMVEAGYFNVTVPEREEQRRHEFKMTFSGGAQAVLKAHSATEAVRLAGRGQPEEIIDLTEAGLMTGGAS